MIAPRILILENNLDQANYVGRLFSDEGGLVEIVTNAADFLCSPRLLEQNIDAVLIDVRFGDVSGLSLIDPLVRRWPKAIIGMISANVSNDNEVLAKAREKGAHFVLPKPFSRMDVESIMIDIREFRDKGEMRKHVIIIDENPAASVVARNLLKAAGFRVTTFQDGFEAVQKFSYDKVDVALVDMIMRRMSGAEMISLIHDVWAGASVIAMTVDSNLAKKAGADANVPKPFSPQELISVVKELANKDYFCLDC